MQGRSRQSQYGQMTVARRRQANISDDLHGMALHCLPLNDLPPYLHPHVIHPWLPAEITMENANTAMDRPVCIEGWILT